MDAGGSLNDGLVRWVIEGEQGIGGGSGGVYNALENP